VRWVLVLGLMVGLTGCGKEKPDLAGPAFDPVAFFSGHVKSWGVVEDRSGAPEERVETDCVGTSDGADGLTMVQHLNIQGDKPVVRRWSLRRLGDGRFEATANDMVGTAVGSVTGRMFHWQWVWARSPGDPLMNVTMSQWMYRMDDGSALVRTTISKLGVILAEVTEQFRPVGG
jgi:hypothetical protein